MKIRSHRRPAQPSKPYVESKSPGFSDGMDFTAMMSDPSFAEALETLGRVSEEIEAEEAAAAQPVKEANPDRLDLDDVIAEHDQGEFTSGFDASRKTFRTELLNQMRTGVAMLTGISDMAVVLKAFTTAGIALDTTTMQFLLERSLQTKYLTLLLDTLNLSDAVKEKVLSNYLLRVWGPEPPKVPVIRMPDVHVKVDATKTQERVTRGATVNSGTSTTPARPVRNRPSIGLSRPPY